MGLSASDIVPALDIRSFHFSYGSTPVLRDISLTVMKGDWVAIVGPNGAGKSTLLKCLNRTLPGRHEGISLQGKALGEYSQKTLAREIAYVPQASHVMPGFSALEFVRMARYPTWVPWAGPIDGTNGPPIAHWKKPAAWP